MDQQEPTMTYSDVQAAQDLAYVTGRPYDTIMWFAAEMVAQNHVGTYAAAIVAAGEELGYRQYPGRHRS